MIRSGDLFFRGAQNLLLAAAIAQGDDFPSPGHCDLGVSLHFVPL